MNTKTGVQIKTDRKSTDHEYRLPPDYMTRKEHDEDVSEAAEQIKKQIPEGFSGHWDDLEGKPFYKKLTLLESQADAEFTDAYGADSITLAFLVNKGYTLESGDLIINFDGVEYNCHRIGGSYSIMDDTNRSTVSFWGNGSYIPDNFYSLYSFDTKAAFADTGEPFAVAIFNNTSGYVSEGIVYAAASAMGNTHSFSISNTDVKTIEDVCIPTTIPRTPTAEVGQVIRVAAVDENGVPTEWEAADMGGGGTELIYEGSVTISEYEDYGHAGLSENISLEDNSVYMVFFKGLYGNADIWASRDNGYSSPGIGASDYSSVNADKPYHISRYGVDKLGYTLSLFVTADYVNKTISLKIYKLA